MAATLLRSRSVNVRAIRFELEANLVVYEEEKESMKVLESIKAEISPAARRHWMESQHEKIALEGLYLQAAGMDFQRPEAPSNTEKSALEAFFEAMHGRRWRDLAGWLGRKGTANVRGVSPFFCHPWCWTGVECGIGTVQGLSLPGNQLQGVIPGPAIAKLTGLVTLDLSDNEIEGSLPAELGKLVHLQTLRLAVTKVEGPIPASFGNLTGLRELDLSSGGLSGEIPPSLGECSKLNVLNLSHNHFKGAIPPELGMLHGLRQLSLGQNQLTGAIPDSFHGLVRLRELNLSCNSLKGTIPPWVGELTSLQRLLLDHNRLYGRLPRSVEHLGNLEVLHLQLNRLSGKVPRGLGKLTNLRVINMSSNELGGKVPPELGNLTKLVGLELGYNHITGPLPKELGRLARLADFHVLEGCPSYSLPLPRGFKRHEFERVFVAGPALGLNNTTYPCGEKWLNPWKK